MQRQMPVVPRTPSQLTAKTNYNRDYTEILLSCYIKKEEIEKIKDFLKTREESRQKVPAKDPIFDVDTAIEVCRQ